MFLYAPAIGVFHSSLPSLTSRQMASSSLPRWTRVYARLPTTATEDYPSPPGTFHSNFGPSFGQVVSTFSGDEPLRFGPSHCGQSAACPRRPPHRMVASAMFILRMIILRCERL